MIDLGWEINVNNIIIKDNSGSQQHHTISDTLTNLHYTCICSCSLNTHLYLELLARYRFVYQIKYWQLKCMHASKRMQNPIWILDIDQTSSACKITWICLNVCVCVCLLVHLLCDGKEREATFICIQNDQKEGHSNS